MIMERGPKAPSPKLDPVKLFIASILLGKPPAHVREVIESVAVDTDGDSEGSWGIHLDASELGLRQMIYYFKEHSPMYNEMAWLYNEINQ
jgi:hypothetical protein